jgi:Lon protease-like protein
VNPAPGAPPSLSGAAVFAGRLPLFPLPETVLLPGDSLPLQVFEARYRRLAADALQGDRLIGIALLRPGWEKDYEGRPPVHADIGVGRVEEAAKLPDGRYLLRLAGVCRARVRRESEGGEYRVAEVVLPTEPLLTADADPGLLERLCRLARRLVAEGRLPPAATRRLDRGDRPLSALCDRLASLSPLTATEKQSLLSTLPALARARLLETFLGRRQRGFLDHAEYRLSHRPDAAS